MELSINNIPMNHESFHDSVISNNPETEINITTTERTASSSLPRNAGLLPPVSSSLPVPSELCSKQYPSSSTTDNTSVHILTDNSSSDMDDNSLNDDNSSHSTIKSSTNLSVNTTTTTMPAENSRSFLVPSSSNFTSNRNNNDAGVDHHPLETSSSSSGINNNDIPSLSSSTVIQSTTLESHQPITNDQQQHSTSLESSPSLQVTVPSSSSSSSTSLTDNQQSMTLHSSLSLVNNAYTSRFRGVYWRQKAWCAQIQHGGKKIYLGTHESEIAAAKEYDIAARKYHGTRALTNFDEQGNLITTNLLTRSGLREQGSVYPPNGSNGDRSLPSTNASPHQTRSISVRHHRDPIFSSSSVPDPLLVDVSPTSPSSHVLRSSTRLRRQSIDNGSNDHGNDHHTNIVPPASNLPDTAPKRKRSKDFFHNNNNNYNNKPSMKKHAGDTGIQTNFSSSSTSYYRTNGTNTVHERANQRMSTDEQHPVMRNKDIRNTSIPVGSLGGSLSTLVPQTVTVTVEDSDYDQSLLMNILDFDEKQNTMDSTSLNIPHTNGAALPSSAFFNENNQASDITNQFSSVFSTSAATAASSSVFGTTSTHNGRNLTSSSSSSSLSASQSSLDMGHPSIHQPDTSLTTTAVGMSSSGRESMFGSPSISPNSQRLLTQFPSMVNTKSSLQASSSRNMHQLLKEKGYGVPGISTVPSSMIVNSFLESHHQQTSTSGNSPLGLSSSSSSATAASNLMNSSGNSTGNHSNLQNIIAMALRSNPSTTTNTLDSNLRTFQQHPPALVPVPSALSTHSNHPTSSSLPGDLSGSVHRHTNASTDNATTANKLNTAVVSIPFFPPPPLTVLPRSISEFSHETNDTNNDNSSIQSSSYPFNGTVSPNGQPSVNNTNNQYITDKASPVPALPLPPPPRGRAEGLHRTLSQSSYGTVHCSGNVTESETSSFAEMGGNTNNSINRTHGPRDTSSLLGTNRNSRYGLIVREDGVRLRGKLSMIEKEKVDTFLKAVEDGKIVLQKGELSKALQSAVNPERPVGFYEKLVSRRGLNSMFESVLLSPTSSSSNVLSPNLGPITATTNTLSPTPSTMLTNNNNNTSNGPKTVGTTTNKLNVNTVGSVITSTTTPPVKVIPSSTIHNDYTSTTTAATTTTLSSSPPRTWGNPNIYGPGIGHGRYSIAVPSTTSLPADMYPDSGFRYPPLPIQSLSNNNKK